MSYLSSMSYFPNVGSLSSQPWFGEDFEEMFRGNSTFALDGNGMPSDEAPPFSYMIHSYRVKEDGNISSRSHYALQMLTEDEFFGAHDWTGTFNGNLALDQWLALLLIEELVIAYTDSTLAPGGPLRGFLFIRDVRLTHVHGEMNYHMECFVRNYRMRLTVRDPFLIALPYYHVWECERESECCVCYNTALQTGYWCGHTVCHRCYVGIGHTHDLRCPMCRYH